ncbi:plasmid mobilization relaxosome protein MobC (plasmid) [Guyparkeria sp. 1SP6A2]|nr:plasmid mobilization relaxosome protein MobC [Guyparkeria sp. 1SP6A2]
MRLTDDEQEAVAALADAEGFPTPTTWAAAVLRAAIHRDAVLTDAEIAALRESTRELAAVGRNLNQIAHTLNIEASRSNQARVTDGLIDAVAEHVEANKAAVSALIHRNLSRWEVEDGE